MTGYQTARQARIRKMLATMLAAILMMLLSDPLRTGASSYVSAGNIADGIVELHAGVESGDRFYRIKSASGFIVTNDDNGVYIITASSAISLTEEEISEALSAAGNRADANYTKSVRVAVSGDVQEELSVEAQSESEDFAILRAQSVVSAHSALKLETEESRYTGETVLSYGFSLDEEGAGTGFPDITRGTITAADGTDNDRQGFFHTAETVSGGIGGPVVNDRGYVIGINVPSSGSADEASGEGVFALSIARIRVVLDNFGIRYGSSGLDSAYERLSALYEECEKMAESGDYRYDSTSEMKELLEETNALLLSQTYDVNELTDAEAALRTKRSRMEKKTPALKVIEIILLIAILFLSVRLFLLLIERKNRYRQSGEADIYRDNQWEATLTIRDTGETVPVLGRQFIIGRNRGEVNLALSQGGKVSRTHAAIYWSEDGYFIKDLNSSNGTFLNGYPVPPEGMYLKTHDRITLANAELIFTEYR